MFSALRTNRPTTARPAIDNAENDYLPCMFIFGLGVGFFTALATGSMLVAAGGCILGAIIGLALAD